MAKGGNALQWPDVDDMEAEIEAYFAQCDARVKQIVTGKGDERRVAEVSMPETYTIQGLAVYLDLTTKGLLGYEKRRGFGSTIKKAKARIEANKVAHLLDGDGYGPGRIFDLKNNCGWKDKQEVEHSGEIKGPLIIVRGPGTRKAKKEA